MILFALFFGLANAAPEMIPLEDASIVGRTAPDFSLPLSTGGVFTLKEKRGKPVVLAFWASWCSPCRHELPDLEQWINSGADVELATINVDRTQSAARRFLSTIQFSQPIAWDPKAQVMGSYQVLSMPTIVLIDGQGTVEWVKVGYSRKKGGLTDLKQKVSELK